MTTGFVTSLRRRFAAQPAPVQTETSKTLAALRMATGPGYAAGGVSDRMLQEATRR